MPGTVVALWVGVAGWLCFAGVLAWVKAPQMRGGDLAAGAALRVFQLYARLMHRVRYEGLEHVPARSPEGLGQRPLLVVSNHTAGIDPVLIQAGLGFEVRWVMAKDMRVEALGWLWELGRVVFVDRQQRDATGIREAMRHLKGNLTLGVFPEGSIERPARRILPFQPGIALLAARSRALILPVIVEGTPQVDPAWASIWRLSRSRVRFLPLIDPGAEGIAPDDLAPHLRAVLARETGWPLNDHPPRFEDGRWWYVGPDGQRMSAAEFERR